MSRYMSSHRRARPAVVLVMTLALADSVLAQTPITLDSNKYSLTDDVKLGQEAAAQVRKELPLVNDGRVDSWVDEVGRKLVRAIPTEFNHPEFRYTFEVVNQKEINAFALPGGPMFLNRGMIEAAKSEAEVAGVMAHEISHVALRHGTAQATKGERFQLGALAGQVIGAIVGGTAGSVIAQGSQFGLGTYFLKYGRAYESQADLLGAQILARAGYDPRQMANMFKTIEAQSRGGGPEWLSSHPNPGNRYDAINREAANLHVSGNADTGDFPAVRARLADMSPAPTAEQIAKGKVTGNRPPTASNRSVTVRAPSSQFRTRRPSSFLTVSVPENWEEVSAGEGAVTYAPDGGFFSQGGQTSFTHGIQIGVQGGSGNLRQDTDQFLQGLARANPGLRRRSNFSRDRVGGRSGLTTMLTNVSDVTGQTESIALSTTQLSDGSVLFLIGVAPQKEADAYGRTFRRIRQDLEITDR